MYNRTALVWNIWVNIPGSAWVNILDQYSPVSDNRLGWR